MGGRGCRLGSQPDEGGVLLGIIESREGVVARPGPGLEVRGDVTEVPV